MTPFQKNYFIPQGPELLKDILKLRVTFLDFARLVSTRRNYFPS